LPEAEDAAHQLGVAGYLVKPVSKDVLLNALAELKPGAQDVLLVDDQPEALQLLGRMLASTPSPYRVLRAKSGDRALALLRERRPDVAILDLVMPGMDGFKVLSEKSRDPAISEIPVIVLSSRDPAGQPIVSKALTVSRGDGLSVADLLSCMRALSSILSPGPRPHREPTTEPGG
jgi:CheY-like chemotaxis protein